MNSKVLKSITPATRWEDAFPTGNGSIGILVYGNICNDTVIFNHEALWIPSVETELPNISGDLPELREMMLNEEFSMVEYFLDAMIKEKGGHLKQSQSSYHPAGELIIKTDAHTPFTNYNRKLDLQSGLITIQWDEAQFHFKRESFVSRKNDFICMKFTGDIGRQYQISLKPRKLTEENRAFLKNLKMNDIPIKYDQIIEKSIIILKGTYENGDNFGIVGKINHKLEDIIPQATEITINNSTNTEILLKIIPKNCDNNAIEQAKNALNQISGTFNELFEDHLKIHQELFNRVEFSIEQEKQNSLDKQKEKMESTLDYQLLATYNGAISNFLFEQLFYYGRFLLICSSRPNGWPANLQGVWNGNYFPAWSSDYHNDENVQMNYWAALPGNLAETTLPYFDFYEQCIPDCQKNARNIFGTRGILIPIAQTVKGKAPPYGGPWLNWTAGAGWIAQLYFDYWLFTGDDHFLQNHAIPYLKEVAFFYEDFLFKGKDGKYVFCPSLSPENTPNMPGASIASINATMDIAVAKEIFTNLCNGCSHLGIENDNVQKWRQMIEDLPEYAINEDGALREWIWPSLKDNYEHRHLSHIYGLFPGFEITETFLPKIYDACRIAVEKRQVVGQMSQSGWSMAHMTNIYARLREGDQALGVLQTLIRSCVGPNLFTYHNDWRDQGLTLYWGFIDRIFQIDANFGITAAMLEMVLFSNQDMISILPACPKQWPKGNVKGLMARGGIQITMAWDFPANQLSIQMISKCTQRKLVRVPKSIKKMESKHNSNGLHASKKGEDYFEVDLIANECLNIEIEFD